MEEAYNELYQQFLRLRSLCLRQAAMLHQLTTALQKQQGAAAPNGELSDMTSIPVQCSQGPVHSHEGRPPPTAAAQGGVNRLSRNVGTFSDLLAGDMSKLCVDAPRQRKDGEESERKAAPLFTLDASRWQGASASESKHPRQADHRGRGRTLHKAGMPAPDCLSLLADFPSPPGGLLMSDVALQSHVCNFCQAVFPGDTTTRGEFLRHLHNHVT